MSTQTLSRNSEVVKQWHSEYAKVDGMIREIRRWIRESSQYGTPCLRQLAIQLRDFSAPLLTHFQYGDELYESLRLDRWCVEVESAQRQAAADHQHLLARLDAYVSQWEAVTLSPASFEQAQDQLEWFFDELDQLEERESDSFEWLLQTDCS